MKSRSLVTSIIALTFAALLPGLASAQIDSLGAADTLYATLAQINPTNWSVTFSYTNDEKVVGMAIPIHLDAGLNKIVADSIKFDDRVANWDYKSFRPDTAIQCVTIGLIANLSREYKVMLPGSGNLATLYISSMENKPIEKLSIDTTTTSPNNTLMAVADMIQGTPPDTVRLSIMATKIRPAWVVRVSPKAK